MCQGRPPQYQGGGTVAIRVPRAGGLRQQQHVVDTLNATVFIKIAWILVQKLPSPTSGAGQPKGQHQPSILRCMTA